MYIRVNVGNSFCGCNEEYLLDFTGFVDINDIDDFCANWIYDTYTYTYENPEDFNCEDDEEYEDLIFDNMHWEEISEEEFIRLRDEEGLEVRN